MSRENRERGVCKQIPLSLSGLTSELLGIVPAVIEQPPHFFLITPDAYFPV